MAELLEETRPVRYSKNGYSPEWIEEAKKRGLYVNEKFFENVENFKEAGKVFVDIGVSKEKEVEAKFETLFEMYDNTVKTESNALQTIFSNEIIPRCYEFLRLVESDSKSSIINKRSEKFIALF